MTTYTDEQLLAWYDEVWPGRKPGHGGPHEYIEAVRRALEAATIGDAQIEWGSDDREEDNRVRRLRQLAGIDDDRELVMRMMCAMRKAMGGKVNEGTLHDAARAALAAVREVEP
jgi:hypothetical protein